MRVLQLLLVLSVTVGYFVGNAQPPPPPPIDPEQPPPPPGDGPPAPPELPPTGCEPDMSCDSTYQVEVVGSSPCQAAQDFQACTQKAVDLCIPPVSSMVEAMASAAQAAVADKCNQVSEQLPSCANTCVGYENTAMGDWANSQQESGCGQYALYKQCLQNFEDSADANCKVTSFLAEAVTKYNTECSKNCTDVYNECNKNLPKLAADKTKSQETCLLWSVCKRYDFSLCQETLMLNYDTQCGAPETTSTVESVTSQTNNTQNSNGVLGRISNMGFVVALGLFCGVLL